MQPAGGLVPEPVAQHSHFFVELFAGAGPLTAAVRATGVPCLAPQDIEHGGADLADDDQFEQLLDLWRHSCAQGLLPIFHMGTPCSSFSRARDRSARTRIRSPQHPWGLFPHPASQLGNQLAIRSACCVRLFLELGGTGSIENPASSYIWPVLDELLGDLESVDIFYHQCRFGSPFKKPTRLRVWGDLDLASRANMCKPPPSTQQAANIRADVVTTWNWALAKRPRV